MAAKKNADILITGMQPVWVDAGNKILVLVGYAMTVKIFLHDNLFIKKLKNLDAYTCV